MHPAMKRVFALWYCNRDGKQKTVQSRRSAAGSASKTYKYISTYSARQEF